MKLLSLVSAVALPLFLSAACANIQKFEPTPYWEPVPSITAEGYIPEKLASLDALVTELNTQSLFVISRGRVLYSYGDVSDTGYIASVRKSVLALMYGPYVASGHIELDATLAELDIDDHGGLLEVEKRARVRDLMSARSGVYHPAANGGDSLTDAPPRGAKKPGSYFLYNNWDFNAVGGIFEQQTGLSVYKALEQDMAIPLGFQDFDYEYQELHGDGSKSRYLAYHMFLSARDLARIGLLMLQQGRWGDKQLYSRAWVQKITSEVTDMHDMNPARQRSAGFDFGYMWWSFDKRQAEPPYKGAYLAQGSYGQFLMVIPDLNMVIVHKTRYRPVKSKAEYDAVAVSWQQFKQIADMIIGARQR